MHYVIQNASIMINLSGILARLVYMSTFVGSLIDYFIYTITGNMSSFMMVI